MLDRAVEVRFAALLRPLDDAFALPPGFAMVAHPHDMTQGAACGIPVWRRALSATGRSQSGVVLASADNCGRLQLWRYPASGDAPCSRKYAGHAAQIANLTFSSDDVRLLTTGGGDGVVMQWRHESEVGFEDEATRVTDEPTPEEKPDYVDGRDLDGWIAQLEASQAAQS